MDTRNILKKEINKILPLAKILQSRTIISGNEFKTIYNEFDKVTTNSEIDNIINKHINMQ